MAFKPKAPMFLPQSIKLPEPTFTTVEAPLVEAIVEVSLLDSIIAEPTHRPVPQDEQPYYLRQEYRFKLWTTWASACVGNGNEWVCTVEGWAEMLNNRGFAFDAQAAGGINDLNENHAIQGSCEQVCEHLAWKTLNYYDNNPFLVALRVTLSRNGKSVSMFWKEGMRAPESHVSFGRAEAYHTGCGGVQIKLDPQISD